MTAEHRTMIDDIRGGIHSEPLTDISTREDIENFVTEFYSKLLKDPQLAPIFIDVAEIDLSVHLPLIIDYWEKLLLGGQKYQRHTMNIHRKVHSNRPLNAMDFERWLLHFESSMDQKYQGQVASRAKRLAATIAQNMLLSL